MQWCASTVRGVHLDVEELNLFWCFLKRLQAEKDLIEREGREKETKILSLNRQMDEIQDRLKESERVRTQNARELDDLMSSKDDVGKSVRYFSTCSSFQDILLLLLSKFWAFWVISLTNCKSSNSKFSPLYRLLRCFM